MKLIDRLTQQSLQAEELLHLDAIVPERYVLEQDEQIQSVKKRGAKTFNAHCKNTVFKYPNGRSKLHPTEKNHNLLEDLILDNSNENDLVFDPCFGSGSHLFVARKLNRNYLGFEINKEYFSIATNKRGL